MPPLYIVGSTKLSFESTESDLDELDRRRLEAAAGGDRGAFDELAESHSGALFRFARTLVQGEAAAEDVLQETLIAAYRGASTYRGEGRVRAWLFTIARNKAMRSLRAHPTSEFDEGSIRSLGLEAGWGVGSDPEHVAEASERRAILARALGSLAPEDRSVITLHDLDELTGPETARILDVPVAAMKSRLHRARLRLMAALRREHLRNA